ncbi:hypothetical protein [Acidovorax sp. Leaf78]|uniref:hypothetical protein n=1 Tax=Acidovorax sp. Leaf78 TaxID=1736237 RepID=UPI0006FA2A74|nr:hypothetical protein [Acidovorax sp. Leaf78]KQO23480.1 hypothetical protein ASF16_04775 [Acidovorax sp. Leaf78]
MTNHTPSRAEAATNEDSTALPQRVAALELLVQNLVFVLDAQGAMDADAFGRWMETAIGRMVATCCVPAGTVAALGALTAQVAQ